MFDPFPLLILKVPNVSFVPCSLLWVHPIQWLFPYLCPKLQQSILTSIFLNDVLPHGHHSYFVFSSTGLIMELPCFMICRYKVLSPIHVDKFLHWTPYNCLISLTTLQTIYHSTLLDFSFPCMNCCSPAPFKSLHLMYQLSSAPLDPSRIHSALLNLSQPLGRLAYGT